MKGGRGYTGPDTMRGRLRAYGLWSFSVVGGILRLMQGAACRGLFGRVFGFLQRLFAEQGQPVIILRLGWVREIGVRRVYGQRFWLSAATPLGCFCAMSCWLS